jgi:NADPH2:quinone reductase
MRAAVLEEFGRPLVLRDVPKPAAGRGQVLVRIVASGVNPLDVKIHDGQADHARVRPPFVLGMDLAGVVEAVGPGTEGFAPGDEVYGLTGGVGGLQGSLAQFAAVDARLLAHKPAAVSFREAAAMPLVVITAWEGLVDRAGVREGERVLVHGGAGGVGSAAVQIAKARGAEVFATESAERAELVESLGARPIDRSTAVDAYVGEHTGGKGFDVVFDTVGGTVLDASFAAVRTYTGRVVSSLGWGTHSIAPLSFKGATYSGVFTLLPMLTGEGRDHHGEILRAARAMVDAGRLRALLDPRRHALETADEAHELIRTGAAKGKLVVDIADA